MHPSPLDLTILIPTYDRPSDVSLRLSELLTGFDNSAPIIIQVNPGRFSLRDIDVPPSLASVSIRQNLSNIGFVANVVCGLSAVSTEWVWILGDDDQLEPRAENIIRSFLVAEQSRSIHAFVFNQWRQPKDSHATVCRTIEQFLSATDFGDCLFISSLLWRTSFLRQNLGDFIDYSFTRASQVVVQLSALAEKRAAICVVNTSLFVSVSPPAWSRIDYLRRVDKILLSKCLSPHARRLSAFMRPQLQWALMSSLDELSTYDDYISWLSVVLHYLHFFFRYEGFSAFFCTLLLLASYIHYLLWNKMRKYVRRLSRTIFSIVGLP